MNSLNAWRWPWLSALWLISSVGIVANSHVIFAANKTWDGSTSQDFNTAANWNIGGAATVLPAASDNAFIQLETANVTLSSLTHVNNLTLSNGGLLATFGQSLSVDDTTTLNENTSGQVQLRVNSGAVAIEFSTNFLR